MFKAWAYTSKKRDLSVFIKRAHSYGGEIWTMSRHQAGNRFVWKAPQGFAPVTVEDW